jgi:hypothetical protein
MESKPQEYDQGNPPNFGQMLELVASGNSIGFVVFSNEWGISYRILEPGNVEATPGEGETLLPMSPEDARQMLTDLADAPEELAEGGTYQANTPSN